VKHFQDIEQPACPVIGLADEYRPGFTDPIHSHQRSQLLYASRGVMWVMVPSAHFCVPPQRALWIPGGTLHEVHCRGEVSLRTLYFDDSTALPGSGCRIIETSAFLRALIVEVVSFGGSYPAGGRESRISQLLTDEIKTMPTAPFLVPLPDAPRLLRVCRAFLADPADRRGLDAWAGLAGMGRRTLTRQFKAATGMGLGAWSQQARLMEALALMASGHSVTEVAFTLGYESPSAFTAMFRRCFGTPPSRYRCLATPGSAPASAHPSASATGPG
jgi:AraC-like DNA-binding protein